MKHLLLLGLIGLFCCSGPTQNPETIEATTVSKTPESNETMMAAMFDKAMTFQKSLTAQQKDSLTFPFEHPDREDWHFIPRHPRFGLRMAF